MRRLFLYFSFLMSVGVNAQTFEWAFQLGGTGVSTINEMTMGDSGRVFVAGHFSSQMDFDPDTGVHIGYPSALRTTFIAQYDTARNFISKEIINLSGSLNITDLTFDGAGKLLVTGYFEDTVLIKDGSSSQQLISNADKDVFIVKYDSQFNIDWVHTFGGPRWDVGQKVKIGPSNTVYVFGGMLDSMDINPSSNVHMLVGRNFFVKFSASGNMIWAHTLGNANQGLVGDVNARGDVVLGGEIDGTIDVDPDTGTVSYTSIGWGPDIFFAKYNANGKYLLSGHMPGSDIAYGNEILFDVNDNIYFAGVFQQKVDFDPSPDTAFLYATTSSGGNYNVFLAKYDSSGDYLWGKSIGSNNYTDWTNDIAVDNYGDVYITGEVDGLAIFNPSNPYVALNTGSYKNMFFAKYRSNGNIAYAKLIKGFWDISSDIELDVVGNLYMAGSFSDSSDFDPSTSNYYMSAVGTSLYHDDAFLVKYGQCIPEYFKSDTFNICQGQTHIFHDSTTGSATGLHASLFSSFRGCDSIITSQLYVNPNFSRTNIARICKGEYYIFPDGDSASVTMIDTSYLTSTAGCDSLIITDLILDIIDVGVIQSNDTLTAQMANVGYQWLDCANSFTPVSGANSKQFKPTISGKYAVKISKFSCSDTSSCYDVTIVGIGELELTNSIHLYPNPTSGLIRIEFDFLSEEFDVNLSDAAGRSLHKATLYDLRYFELNITQESGLYILKLTFPDGESVIYKILKN